jgi:glucose/arabinose dehydrogenase
VSLVPTPTPPRIFRVLLATVGLALLALPAHSQTAPVGFVVENAFPTETFTLPVQVVFLPDGRRLVVEKEGRIWTITAAGVKLPTPFIDLNTKVLSNDDRGLHGVALDPDFTSNRWVYLLFTVDPDSNGVDDNIGAYARLVRYRTNAVNPNVLDPTTREVLIGPSWTLGIPQPPRNRHHMVGTLRFARDKTLMVGSGDAANADLVDAGGTDPLTSYGPGKTDPAEDIGSFRSQTLNSMDGKILRVDKETGAGLPSNPFWDGNPTSDRSRVWLYGLRNPFRFALRPGTGSTDPAAGQPGVLYIGDVGWNKTSDGPAWKDPSSNRATTR